MIDMMQDLAERLKNMPPIKYVWGGTDVDCKRCSKPIHKGDEISTTYFQDGLGGGILEIPVHVYCKPLTRDEIYKEFKKAKR